MVEWDLDKASTNLEKHGIDFADAVAVLSDEMALTVHDAYTGEERYVTLGMDALGRLLVVAYSWRDEDVRIISARKANRSERRQYEGKR
ncbi:MAG: BrnT family toxin [Candidatus Binatia bacterium]